MEDATKARAQRLQPLQQDIQAALDELPTSLGALPLRVAAEQVLHACSKENHHGMMLMSRNLSLV